MSSLNVKGVVKTWFQGSTVWCLYDKSSSALVCVLPSSKDSTLVPLPGTVPCLDKKFSDVEHPAHEKFDV
jgi:hypothetical protein